MALGWLEQGKDHTGLEPAFFHCLEQFNPHQSQLENLQHLFVVLGMEYGGTALNPEQKRRTQTMP